MFSTLSSDEARGMIRAVFYLILLLIKCINYGWVVSGIFLPPSIIVFKILNNHLFILYYI